MGIFKNEKIGIDLGTSNVRIYIKDQGIVLKESSAIAVNKNNGDILAVGQEACSMLGRVPINISVVRPLRNGVISSYHYTAAMLYCFLKKIVNNKPFMRPQVMVCMPSGVTDVEQRAIIEVAKEAGASHACLIEEPIAAAIGAGLDIASPYGNMIIDIGGGTTDIAVVAMGGMIVNQSIRIAGDSFDEAIIRYIRNKYDLVIGERTAERIKITIGSALPREESIFMEVFGRDFLTGLPKKQKIYSTDTQKAFQALLNSIVFTIQNVLNITPPEHIADVSENGICLTGGGSLLYGIERLISEKTGVPCYIASDPLSCVAIGTGESAGTILKKSYMI